SRFAYRWDPDRFEERQGAQRGSYRSDGHERIQSRDRYEPLGRPDFDDGYGRGNYSDGRGDYENGRGYYGAGRESDRFGRDDYERNRDYDSRDYGREVNRDYDRDFSRDHVRDYERGRHFLGESPNRENWSSGDFDQRWDYGRRDEERDLPSDRGYVRDRTYG